MAKLFGGNVINQQVTVYPGGTAYTSDPIVGSGDAQVFVHGLPFTPTRVLVVPTHIPAGSSWDYTVSSVTASLITVTTTTGVTFIVFAWTGVSATGPIRLTSPNNSVWEVKANENGVIETVLVPGLAGSGSVVLEGADGSRWTLTVGDDGALTTTKLGSSLVAAKLAHYAPDRIPVPSDFWHGSLITVVAPGMDEEILYCRMKADRSYEWIVVAM